MNNLCVMVLSLHSVITYESCSNFSKSFLRKGWIDDNGGGGWASKEPKYDCRIFEYPLINQLKQTN